MLIVISPAKSLDFDSPLPTPTHTQPQFQEESQILINKLSKMSRKKLRELMDISPNLALLNSERYKSWELPFTPENARQAVLAFKGDVYLGLEPYSFNESDFEFAQDHLRILSGLHGLLRPLDLIQPYRLEMGSQLPIRRKKNLYGFWGQKITEAVNESLNAQGDDVLINLASQEYYNSIQPKKLNARVITINFKEWRKGKLKFVSFSAKRARGTMSQFIIKHKLSEPSHIKGFMEDGYAFSEEFSEGDNWLFTREIEG